MASRPNTATLASRSHAPPTATASRKSNGSDKSPDTDKLGSKTPTPQTSPTGAGPSKGLATNTLSLLHEAVQADHTEEADRFLPMRS
ncbi:hypothetical protein WJX74_007901 [Apatococcus lobatus]|uniref:Uncharacterized protein n=1 Tax=Apatococcus lobatus TaxID=904363 RepID=A0AAW1RDQ0_9CHLO